MGASRWIDIIPGCVGTIEIEPGTQDGPTAEDINDCALAVMTALWEAMAPLYEGSEEFPPGVSIDLSNFIEPGDEPPYGGIVIVTFTDYTPSGSDVIVNGDLTIDVTFPPDLLGTFEEAISASLSVSCLPGETVDIDLTLSMFMEDAPYWQTLQWSGMITVDGREAEIDQVMSDWLAMVLEATTPTDGMLTVRLTGADDYDDAFFYYAVVAEGYDLTNPDYWLGVAPTNPTISGGTVECITTEFGTDTPAVFTGGESYDVGGLIDVDRDGYPTSGDYVFGPVPVFVNGDTLLEIPFPMNFSPVP